MTCLDLRSVNGQPPFELLMDLMNETTKVIQSFMSKGEDRIPKLTIKHLEEIKNGSSPTASAPITPSEKECIPFPKALDGDVREKPCETPMVIDEEKVFYSKPSR